MPAPATSRRGPPITSPKPNVGFSPVPPPLAFAKPTKTEETLRQENEKLRRKLEANSLAKGFKEAHFRLEEEVEAWRQKCEGFSEAIKELRIEVEGMINSRISKFFDQMEEEKEEAGKEEEEEVKEREEKEGKERERKEEEKIKERKEKEWKEKKRKEKEREEKGGKGKGKEGEEEKENKANKAELYARQEENRQSSFEQIQAYRQRKKVEERRRKKWWT